MFWYQLYHLTVYKKSITQHTLQNISLVIIFVSLYIFLFSKLKIFLKYKKFNQVKDKLSKLRFKFLRKIIFFSTITYICQILDSWRVAGGEFGGSQIYKTEATLSDLF